MDEREPLAGTRLDRYTMDARSPRSVTGRDIETRAREIKRLEQEIREHPSYHGPSVFRRDECPASLFDLGLRYHSIIQQTNSEGSHIGNLQDQDLVLPYEEMRRIQQKRIAAMNQRSQPTTRERISDSLDYYDWRKIGITLGLGAALVIGGIQAVKYVHGHGAEVKSETAIVSTLDQQPSSPSAVPARPHPGYPRGEVARDHNYSPDQLYYSRWGKITGAEYGALEELCAYLGQDPVQFRSYRVENNHIASLDLNGFGDLGTVPDAVRKCTDLGVLNCRETGLTKLPDWIGELSHLESLYLGGNKLTELPGTIGQLKLLKRLSLGNNQLTRLPPEIGGLVSLVQLNVENNKIDTLPESVGNLLILNYFNGSNNSLYYLPDTFYNLRCLEELYLNKNDISLLSDAIGNFQQLKTCEVAENDLQGLPSTMRSLSNLTKLDIRGMPRNSVSSAFLESLVSLKDVYASSELGGQLTSPYITTRFTVH